MSELPGWHERRISNLDVAQAAINALNAVSPELGLGLELRENGTVGRITFEGDFESSAQLFDPGGTFDRVLAGIEAIATSRTEIDPQAAEEIARDVLL